MSGGSSGPTSPATCNSTWHHKHSQIVYQSSGPVISPNYVEVFLVPTQALNVVIKVTVPPADRQPLDLWLSQDITGSMGDDVATVALLIPRIIANVRSLRPDTYFGFNTYADIPLAYAGGTEDSVFTLLHTLSANYNGLQTKIREIVISWGYDGPEGTLISVVQATCPDYGWRENALKMVVSLTDANYHYEGEMRFSECWNNGVMTKNNYNCIMECKQPPCYPAGTALTPTGASVSVCSWEGTGEDFPSAAGLKAHLTSKNVFPLFVTTSWSVSYYNSLVSTLGFGQVATMASDSSGVVEAIVNGITYLTSNLLMLKSSDPNAYVKSITPTSYSGVVAFSTYPFTVNLLSNTAIVDCLIVLSVLGWGQAQINVTGTYPCFGCDHVKDSDKEYDLCKVCTTKDDANKCLDCYGVPDGLDIYDVCGVCGGDGSSCLDCFGEVFGPAVEDACGVCAGDNSTCFGCDGSPNYPPTMYDLCGVCNGTNACLDCQQVPWGGKELDNCSVCGGTNACMGCDGLFTVPPANYDECGVCGGDATSCFDCLGEKWGKADFDDCGVCAGNNTCIGCDGLPSVPPLAYNECGGCGGFGDCRGCDGVIWSGADFDDCGICNGDNACKDCAGNPYGPFIIDSCGNCLEPGDPELNSCLGCDDIPYSGSELDSCYVCKGTDECVGCDHIPYSGKQYDACGVCGGDGLSCIGCDGTAYSGIVVDVCGVCGGSNECAGCDGVANSGYFYDVCGDCTNDPSSASCYGCDGVAWSGAALDECGVCLGSNTCLGCNGVKYSGLRYDICGVCGGDRECFDCNGTQWGNLTEDSCGVCGGDNSTCSGCDGVLYSGLVYDKCGVCNGTNDCLGCDRVPYSGTVYDDCNVCGGGNRALGCDGVCFSGNYTDQCGKCGGSNECIGCDGIAWSNVTLDDCGECGGKNSCIGCDGQPSSLMYDQCGVCNGTDECVGCDNTPWSGMVTDKCGICGGFDECTGCDDEPWSGLDYDLCGVCGGNDDCMGCDGKLYSNLTNDVCGRCGGDITDPSVCNDAITTNSLIVTGTVIGVTIAGAAAAIAGFFIFKQIKYGANWYIPNALLEGTGESVSNNQLYEEANTMQGSSFYAAPVDAAE